ncbi:RHS repeat domain-containing protein, partial [Escherichia coli]|uniref:RHS repeat domain-containing protein n=1 Tax=Escherichia coli TaxID=562 RepID=UPI0003913F20
KLIRSEDEGLVTHWHYDEADRITQRTVNGETAEQWRYDERGWLTQISHLSEGHRVTVHYGYDEKGRLTGERQTVHHPQTEALLWQHETRHAYNAQGLANRCIPDSLPAVEWLTYGSGWLSGMKLGDTPLVDFTRDRLHRETLRSFGRYELTTAYTSAGQLQSQHLNSLQYDRDYTWNDNGELIRISSPRQTRSYSYSDTGRLTGVHTTAANLDIRIPYATDPAGNRLPDPELHPDSPLSAWPDNRIARDAHYLYRYDRHGRLTEKTDLIPEGVIRTDDERTHRYHYDSRHRLVHYTRTQYAEPLVESRYLYDLLGRRVAKRVWRRERDLTGWMSLSWKPEVPWYGWDGDRLTTIQNDRTRIQTVYQPGSFTPLIRVETATGELAKTQRRSLADALQQSGGEDGGSVVFPPVLVQMLDRLESEILADRVSEESRRWLASCGLTVEQIQNQMDPVYTPARKIHLYHCDHRGLPLALVSTEGATEWCAEYDEWGNLLNEENPHQLQQLIRLPGQQYDEESGLYYNRHRYYDPLQGRYITQDPIGLKGGWNFYQYPLNPVQYIDPLGLADMNFYDESLRRNVSLHAATDKINIPGVFTIGGHGYPGFITDESGNYETAEGLAKRIRANPRYKKGMSVWLFSCGTAREGNKSFASKLARALHANVTGADTQWQVWMAWDNNTPLFNTIQTGLTDNISAIDTSNNVITGNNMGRWITFGPSGQPISSTPGKVMRPSDIK